MGVYVTATFRLNGEKLPIKDWGIRENMDHTLLIVAFDVESALAKCVEGSTASLHVGNKRVIVDAVFRAKDGDTVNFAKKV